MEHVFLEKAKMLMDITKIEQFLEIGKGVFLQTGKQVIEESETFGVDPTDILPEEIYCTTDNGVEPILVDPETLAQIGIDSLGWDEEEKVRQVMAMLGRKTSKAKAQASRENGKLGGRPKKKLKV